MTTNQLAVASVAPPTTGGDWVTVTNLVLIGIGAILALLVIYWGAKLKRQRQAVEQAIEERAEGSSPAPLVASSLDDTPPPAPETEPLPVAPSPPPLADTPVAAAVPFGATPAAPPSGDDDLTRMKGVGPKLAARLHDLGITRFAQIAELTPAEAAALDTQLGAFQGRTARDRWVEQARYLANDDRAGFEAAFGRL